MEDDLTRAEHYRGLADQMRTIAEHEFDTQRWGQLLDLAQQYEHLAEKLVCRQGEARCR